MKSLIEKLKEIDKKVWLFLLSVIVIIILGLFISKMIYLFGNSNKSYSEMENILKNAAIEYYKENTSSLPTTEDDSVTIGDSVLAEEGYMKPLSKLNNNNCSGKVIVTKKENIYNYSPYLDCGKEYKTIEFYKKLTAKTVTENDGLYKDDNGYYFRGENPNNYIEIDGHLWRIISVSNDNTIEIVSTHYADNIIWDDRYNSTTNYNSGYNNFNKSRLKDSLENIYNGKISLNDEKRIFTSGLEKMMITVDNCLDKVGNNDKTFTCNNKNNNKISIINIQEYIRASLDEQCLTPSNEDCENYNYLVTGKSFWTLTGNKNNNAEVYEIRSEGVIKSVEAFDLLNVYPVVRLNSSVMYTTGNGTIEKPYVIR